MKNLLAFLFILFSVGALSAQNLNFKDTIRLKNLLCSHTWFRYYVNPDSSFSDRIMDSVTYKINGTWYQSGRPEEDDSENTVYHTKPIRGTWKIGSTGKMTRNDTATDCISIVWVSIDEHGYGYFNYVMVDGRRIKNSKCGKILGNINGPFIIDRNFHTQEGWDRRDLWQPKHQFKKPKKH